MAEKSTFFNSVNGDRKYTAEDMAAHFAKMLTNGVMPAGTQLQVIEGGGMNVAVSAGSAWINGYAYHNDANFVLAIDPADGVLNRVDRIVVRWNKLARSINLAVLKGTPASSATAPDIVRNADYYDLSIATINVNKGITAITQALIIDTRMNSNVCGFVSSLIQPDTSGWFVQFETAFNEWFDGVKDTLGDNAAGQLQNQINQLKDDDDQIRALETKLPDDIAVALGLDPVDNPQVKDGLYLCGDKIGDIKITNRKDLGDNWILCNGEMVNINSYPQLYNIIEKTNKLKSLPSYMNMENDYNTAYLYSVNGYFIMCLYGDWNGHEHSKVFSCPATQEAISKNLWTSVGINLPVATSLDGVKYYNGKYYFLAYSYTSATNPSSLSSIYYSTTLSGTFTRVPLPRQYTSWSCCARDFDIDNNGNIAIIASDNDRGNLYYRIIHGNVNNLTTETLASIKLNDNDPIKGKSIIYHGGYWYYFSRYKSSYPSVRKIEVFRSSTIANILTSEKQTLYSISSDRDIPTYGAYVDDNYVVIMYKHKDETNIRIQYTTPQDFLFTSEKNNNVIFKCRRCTK